MKDYRDNLDELGLTEEEKTRVRGLLATVQEPDAAFVDEHGQVCVYSLDSLEKVRELRAEGIDAAIPYCVIGGDPMVPLKGTVDCTR